MLDSYYNINKKETHNHKHFPDIMEIHNAPTDDSIKLLNEMHEKTRKNIVEQIMLTKENNLVDGCITMYRSLVDYNYTICAAFILNGRDFFFEYKLDYIPESCITTMKIEMYKRFYEEFAKYILSELMIKDEVST